MQLPVPRSLWRRDTVRDDAAAGLVLGVESVPDGLASGLLAGVNPIYGLHAYLFGMAGAALFTGTAVMAVQGTGAMSIVVADVDLASHDDPSRSLFTLTVLTGALMVAAGALRLGRLLRFVSSSVMTGFVTAVGVNIVLGQLDDLTGHESAGSNRIVRTIDLLVSLGDIDAATLAVGVATIAGIVALQRTRLGSFGLVVAIVGGSGLAVALGGPGHDIATVGDLAALPGSLPAPQLPALREVPSVLLPAASLAFVGLVQGAGVAASFPNPDGRPGDTSQDFVGQGAGNVVAGLFQGMPVGGSVSATALVTGAGAQTRLALLMACGTMALVVVVFAEVVGHVAMPSLAGLLIVVGFGTVKPAKVVAVARTGPVPRTVMAVSFALTMVVPLQYAVMAGVGLSVLLFVVGQSSRLVMRRLVLRDDGTIVEREPPPLLPSAEVVVLQPYGAVFFATAPALRDQLPAVGPDSRRSVVVLRIRGADEAGATFIDVLATYARGLREADCRLVVVTDNRRLLDQLDRTGVAALLGAGSLYRGTPVVYEALRAAHEDALTWIASGGENPSG